MDQHLIVYVVIINYQMTIIESIESNYTSESYGSTLYVEMAWKNGCPYISWWAEISAKIMETSLTNY